MIKSKPLSQITFESVLSSSLLQCVLFINDSFPSDDDIVPELPIKEKLHVQCSALHLRVLVVVPNETVFNQSLNKTRVQSSKMKNFFIPSRKINDVKQKKKGKVFAMVFIKTFFLHFSAAKRRSKSTDRMRSIKLIQL